MNGNGIYKSTDGGDTWSNIYSGGTSVEDKLTYVQDIVAWNNPTTNQTEIFFGADAMAYTEEVSSSSAGAGWNWLGDNTIGLYRSTDGTNFSRLTGSLYESSPGDYYAPNDFDIGADGTLWMGTKYSYSTGEGGGIIFKNDGTGWSNEENLGTNGRVELACSQQTADKIYVLAEDRIVSPNNPISNVEIYNVQGQKVWKKTIIMEEMIQLELASLESSMYFLTVTTTNGTTTKRVAKR